MSESQSWPERYAAFVETVITQTLKGQISSKEQVFRMLTQALEPGTGEIFERGLISRREQVQQQLDRETDELKQAKALRQSRALKVLSEAWERWQKENQDQNICAGAIARLTAATAEDRLSVLFQILDPNQQYVFDRNLISLLGKELEVTDLQPLGLGLQQGLNAFCELEGHLVSWMYDAPQRAVGFENGSQGVGPWAYWAKHTSSSLAKELFAAQAGNQSALAIAKAQDTLDIAAWVALAVLLRGMQNGLIAWFDQQPYSISGGRNLAAMTFLTFAVIWGELSNGFRKATGLPETERNLMASASFQVAIQILRAFAQRENFPLYGGVLFSFSGDAFRETVQYLDQPLRELEQTQEKARILTLIAYSRVWMGDREAGLKLHEEALALAQEAGDHRCEIANLNHLSRVSLSEKDFEGAIGRSQRALILARQKGDQQGEEQALVSVGYSEVRAAQAEERIDADRLALTVERLKQGRQRAEKFRDRVGQILCVNGLGLAYLLLSRYSAAQESLTEAVRMAHDAGHASLHGLSHAYLAEAHYQLDQPEDAVYHGCLGMYLLKQQRNPEWRQAASVVSLAAGKLGKERFERVLEGRRSPLLALIGVDGVDYLPELLKQYREG